MDQPPLVPVVLCGGTGTRLWPLSRAGLPKQFLRLHGEHSLLQQTLQRCCALTPSAPVLVAAAPTRYLIASQLDEIGIRNATLLLEPAARGTAAAIASAACHLQRTLGDALMLVLPSDHLLRDLASFATALHAAADGARTGMLMTFGVTPDGPETGYGYLQRGAELGGGIYRIDAFIEKPDRAHAERLVASRQCLWNSGMFVFDCRSLLQQLADHAPRVLAAAERAEREATRSAGLVHLQAAAYANSPDISIDHALMERTRDAAMLPLDAGWSDIGSWASVWQQAAHDGDGNACHGDVLLDGCRNCHVHSERRLIAACDLDDIVIVDTDDALLVLPKKSAQRTRALVQKLQQNQRPEWQTHRSVQRPWGSYETLVRGERYQVKRLNVLPGASLSLQKHHHRAEHWVVVSGTAHVTCGEQSFLLSENQSTYIDIGVVHALANPGQLPLQLIEVQCGGYLGEDDIVRLSDPYGRTE